MRRPCSGNDNGADLAAPSIIELIWRKRRDSDSRLRHPEGYIGIADVPERRQVGRSRRAAPAVRRPGKLPPERATELRRVSPGRSLRSLAAEFGVSHETVRAILREREPAEVA